MDKELFDSQQGKRFYLFQSIQTGLGSTQLPVQRVLGHKMARAWSWQLNMSSAKIKNAHAVPPFPPYAFMECTGTTLPFTHVCFSYQCHLEVHGWGLLNMWHQIQILYYCTYKYSSKMYAHLAHKSKGARRRCSSANERRWSYIFHFVVKGFRHLGCKMYEHMASAN